MNNFPSAGEVTQAFNPFASISSDFMRQFGFININEFSSSGRDLEMRICHARAGYGRQPGKLMDVMEILMNILEKRNTPQTMSAPGKDAIYDLKSLIRGIKCEKEKAKI